MIVRAADYASYPALLTSPWVCRLLGMEETITVTVRTTSESSNEEKWAEFLRIVRLGVDVEDAAELVGIQDWKS